MIAIKKFYCYPAHAVRVFERVTKQQVALGRSLHSLTKGFILGSGASLRFEFSESPETAEYDLTYFYGRRREESDAAFHGWHVVSMLPMKCSWITAGHFYLLKRESAKARVEAALLPNGTGSFDDKQRAVLFEQYKLFVDTVESASARRQTNNNFFLSANGFVLAAIGLVAKKLVAKELQDSRYAAFIIVAACILGLVLSLTWYRLCRYYGQLIGSKSRVTHILEKNLPAQLFRAEWVALGEGKEPKRYQSFSQVEAGMPKAFAVCYAMVIVAIAVYALSALR
ncbi:MAG: hypothetical protein ABSG80_12240 [Verrucomicrobiota bacterium]|jgi:hypothetical protein